MRAKKIPKTGHFAVQVCPVFGILDFLTEKIERTVVCIKYGRLSTALRKGALIVLRSAPRSLMFMHRI